MSRTTLDLETRLERFGVKGPGRDWLIKALHPPSEMISPGMPDVSNSSVIRPEYRLQATISPPVGTTGSWDCAMWIVPGDVNTLIWAAGPGGTDFGNSAPPTAPWASGHVYLQPTTHYGGALHFIDTAMPSPGTYNFSTNGPTALPFSFRHVYKSVTVSLIASSVSDQGTVYAAQFPPTHFASNTARVIGTNPVAVNLAIARTVNFQPPTNETDLVAMAPERYEGLAKAGVFMPMRLAGPTQNFVSQDKVDTVLFNTSGWNRLLFPPGDTDTNIRLPCYPRIVSPLLPGNAQATTWWTPATNYIGSDPYFCDTNYDNLNQGMIIFRGLNGAGPFPASLMVKVIAGLEIVPAADTPDRVFTKPAVPYDPRAIEAYYALSLELADAYPASYNFMGGILEKVREIATALWPTVRMVGSHVVAALDQSLGSQRAIAPPPPPQPRPPKPKPRSSSVSTVRSKGGLKKAKKVRVKG